MKKIKLAEALLRRKELNDKVAQLRDLKRENIFRTVVKRVKVNEDLDQVDAAVPRVTMPQVTAAYDHHSRALRLIDAAIQQANWTTEVEVEDAVLEDYKERDDLRDDEREMVSAR